MASESLGEIALRILYASVSVVVVTAICIYNYLSRSPRKRSTRQDDAFGDRTSDAIAEKAIATDSPPRRTRIPEKRRSDEDSAVEEINESLHDISKESLFYAKLVNDSPRGNERFADVSLRLPEGGDGDKSGSTEQLVRDILKESFSKKKPPARENRNESPVVGKFVNEKPPTDDLTLIPPREEIKADNDDSLHEEITKTQIITGENLNETSPQPLNEEPVAVEASEESLSGGNSVRNDDASENLFSELLPKGFASPLPVGEPVVITASNEGSFQEILGRNIDVNESLSSDFHLRKSSFPSSEGEPSGVTASNEGFLLENPVKNDDISENLSFDFISKESSFPSPEAESITVAASNKGSLIDYPFKNDDVSESLSSDFLSKEGSFPSLGAEPILLTASDEGSFLEKPFKNDDVSESLSPDLLSGEGSSPPLQEKSVTAKTFDDNLLRENSIKTDVPMTVDYPEQGIRDDINRILLQGKSIVNEIKNQSCEPLAEEDSQAKKSKSLGEDSKEDESLPQNDFPISTSFEESPSINEPAEEESPGEKTKVKTAFQMELEARLKKLKVRRASNEESVSDADKSSESPVSISNEEAEPAQFGRNFQVIVDESSCEEAPSGVDLEREKSVGNHRLSLLVTSDVRRHSDIGPRDTTDNSRDMANLKKFYRKSLPAEFLGVLGSGLEAQRARIGGGFSAQNLRDDPEAGKGRRCSSESPSEAFQREIKNKANMRLTQKNRNILAAHFRDKFSVNNDLFKMIPSPEPIDETQLRFKEAQELLSKQLRQPVIPKSVSPPAELGHGVNGSGEGGGLADRLGKLETAAQGWKKRVGPTDAVQFSVAGRMKGANAEPNPSLVPAVASPVLERKKKVPKPTRFKSKTVTTGGNDSSESDESSHSPTIAVPEINIKKSPSKLNGEINLVIKETNQDHPKVEVPNTYDDSFSLFFSAAPTVDSASSTDVNSFDLDELKIDPSLPKLVQRRTTKVQRRREASRNPVKVLAERKDLKQEYTEIIHGVAEKDLRMLNVEKLSKNSNLAVEALAGLASKEDFTAVSLKKPSLQSNAPMLPYKNLMLLLVKGRRHVQTRLVEPTYKSINKGDTFVLVTPNEIYLWLGEFSNVIERSRGGEVAAHIAQTKDLGYIGANNVITINDGKKSIHQEKFWTLLGASEKDASKIEAENAGHLDEDEIYEISLVGTNMIYEMDGDELVPVEKFWGNIPKIEMLDANKILVFDFGTELYVWNGKNASMERRKIASKLAQELWDEGYDYTDCDISPINASLSLGSRTQGPKSLDKTGTNRPSFTLIGKVTQHMETVLFREKFLDWPDFNRVIRTKSQEEDEKQMVANLDLKPCDILEMQNWKQPEPDFILEGSHLGRGTEYYDDETRRYFAIKTTNVSMWRIEEFEGAKLEDSSVGQFYSGDSYIIQWLYTVSVTGRELNGMPSKHNVSGRDRCAYFIWQGRDASLNEQGAAALLTVELDKERGPQVRLIQGHEPPAFWNLFNGSAVIHRGKRSEPSKKNAWRLYMIRGERENEAQLVEVVCNIKNLRSRGSFILLNPQKSSVFVWHGFKSPKITKKCCNVVVKLLESKRPQEFGFSSGSEISTKEFSEGEESVEFFEGLGGNNRHLYHSLLKNPDSTEFSSMKLFHFSSMLGVFQADPVISHSGSYLQQDLYSASQPALFLLDTSTELWLWQGWWPIDGDILDPENESPVDEAGSGGSHRGAAAIRWQAERRAAMATVLNYWKNAHPNESPKANLVWAGLEPSEFTNLFPEWIDRDDVAELNIRDGRKPCEMLSVERELMRLTKSTYPPEVLLQRPLPEGVDPTRLELYLEPKHFKELLGVTKEEFMELPLWKQTKMKKEACLF